jgi:tryptophan-rich sensory protein
VKTNYIVIPLVVVAVAVLGGFLTAGGMGWYKTISLPSWTPSGTFISVVWTIIFILSAISALIVWNKTPRGTRFKWTAVVFIANAVLNTGWTLLFFKLHFLGTSVWEAGVLGVSVVALIILIWPRARFAAALLIPYVAWVFFATYLTYAVWVLNS